MFVTWLNVAFIVAPSWFAALSSRDELKVATFLWRKYVWVAAREVSADLVDDSRPEEYMLISCPSRQSICPLVRSHSSNPTAVINWVNLDVRFVIECRRFSTIVDDVELCARGWGNSKDRVCLPRLVSPLILHYWLLLFLTLHEALLISWNDRINCWNIWLEILICPFLQVCSFHGLIIASG
jgi:hypothetical protein